MRVLVVGAGHNGLICACYLARAGLDVTVVEQSEAPGGGSRSEETIAGYRFDTHSVAHNIINMTGILDELALGEAGLEYREMDPFATAVFEDGRRVRFHRSVARTVASIAEIDSREARAYADFMADALPLVRAATAGLGARTGRAGRRTSAVGALRAVLGTLRRGPLRVGRELLSPYGSLLEERLPSDLTRAPVSAFAAHAGASPDTPGSAFFALWQAAYHLHGQWHAAGGAQALADALVRRLEEAGGRLRCRAPVARIETRAGRVAGVALEDGERIPADVVVTALNPRVALLELLDPPLAGRHRAQLSAAHASNAVQAVVHVAVDRLPPYTDACPGDWNGLQSYIDTLDALRRSFAAADDRRLHRPVAGYAFTPSALDASLAPDGHHTVYLACPAAPFVVEGGWERHADVLVEDLVAQVERRAPGFRASIRGIAVRTPELMAAELRWPGAHPMHLDITLDQLGPFRPTPALSDHRSPVAGLYVTGAGTAPVGGIAGVPGRSAARAVAKDTLGGGAA